MSDVAYYLAWEWINYSIEYTATAWVKLPRWWMALAAANLATHPAFVALLEKFGREPGFVLMCEACIVVVEALVLSAIYVIRRCPRMLGASLLMNAASYGTGLLIA